MLQRIKLLPLFIEFLGSMTLAMGLLAMSGRTNFPFFGAVIAGVVYGLFLLVCWPIYRVQINPIVTIGMWTMRLIGTLRAIAVVAAQLLGGVAAWQLSEYLLNQPLRNIAGDELDWRVLVAELAGALIFTFVFTIAITKTTDVVSRAFAAGGGLTIGMLVASLASNGLINPAAAIGLQSWSWAYVLGPIAGAFIGMNLLPLLTAIDRRASQRNVVSSKVVSKKTTKKAKTTKKKK